jgi:hypothetical protein
VYTIRPPHIAKYLTTAGTPAHVAAVMLDALDTEVVVDGGGGDTDGNGGDMEPWLSASGAVPCSDRGLKSGIDTGRPLVPGGPPIACMETDGLAGGAGGCG